MKKLKIVFEKIFDLIEIYFPIASFIIVFISYIIIIICRYFLNESIKWLIELNAIAFLWSAMFAASYGGRTDKHIVFSIIYDKLSEKIKKILRLIGNLFLVVVFSILLPYTYEACNFMAKKKTSIMELPFSIIYIPFLIFVILTLLYYTISFVKEIKQCIVCFKGKQSNE